MRINESKLRLIEVENLYEDYTGKLIGQKAKLELEISATDDIRHKITFKELDCGGKNEVEIRVSCGVLGLFETRRFKRKSPLSGSGRIAEIVKTVIRNYETI